MIDSRIAENARAIICSKGLKQRSVAEKMGVSEQQLSAMLNRRKVIKDTDVMAFANALSVTPNELFGISTPHRDIYDAGRGERVV